VALLENIPLYVGHPESKDRLVIKKINGYNIKNILYHYYRP
jgi:hypothetical protein